MKLLAFDTSSNACSIALKIEDKIWQKYEVIPQQHATVILDWVQEILAKAAIDLFQLDAIAYSCGPGSFTGIRIGASVGQALALASGKPLIAVPSLQAIAQRIYRESGGKKVVIVLDARMEQVYCGYYHALEGGVMQQVREDCLRSIHQLDLEIKAPEEWILVTDSFGYKELSSQLAIDTLFQKTIQPVYPHALDSLTIAEHNFLTNKSLTIDQSLPTYLRSEDYWKKACPHPTLSHKWERE
jgi:tRNA threonylcarbamoyladenosine biosynthesis protein TsaB